jgi:predicted Rdx family selenoprotein
MLGAFRSADAGPRGAATRIGLAALLACIGLTWTAGATSAFATYGTVKITKVNEGGDQTDSFHFNASTAIKSTGGFDLKGGQSYSSSTVHANTGAYAGVGAYTVSETADADYDLRDIACSVTPAPGKYTASGSTAKDLANRKVSIRVGVNEKVDCTVYNTRKTGTIIVKKALVPSTDPGKFDLQVDGADVATQVGNGGYGSKTVVTGTHTVGEAGAYLSNYSSSTACKNAAGYAVAVSAAGAVNVGGGDTITCTITNTRKTGTIVVEKQLVPSTDGGTFDLQVDGDNVATQVGDGGYGSKTVPTGTHTVGEAGDNLADYTSATACKNASGYAVDVSAAGAVNVGSGDTITCTITNTRKTGTIVVKKQLAPSTDTGKFDLQVDGDNVATQVGDGGTGSKTVPTGTHTVGEAGANLGDYTSSTSCTDATGTEVAKGSGVLSVAVGNGDTITCTITNTRKVTPTPPSTPQPPVIPSTPQPAPAQAVAGTKTVARPARGTAALTGPRGCPRTTSVSATVRGRQIRRVTFFVRGHKVKTVTKAANGRWTLSMRTSSLRRGANAVTARVEFTAASRTKTRTLRINITRCAAQVVSPQFTG